MDENRGALSDRLNGLAMAVIGGIGIIHLMTYLPLGSLQALFTILLIETLFVLLSLAAWKGRMPWLNLPIAVAAGVLFYTTNYAETTGFNFWFLIQAVAAVLDAVAGVVILLRNQLKCRCIPWVSLVLAGAMGLVFLGSWKWNTDQAKNAQGHARRELWAVPIQFDSTPCDQQGTVEELVYQTKAYGTDERDIEKRALVYLPYGYDENKQYNILYLMHGTGDDENYWLQTNEYNKVMLDHMIAAGEIQPLIVVTPTFYVEDDFADGLDPLTFSFKEELRNDLMPLVESKYATYAQRCDEAGFTASRDHRAFAGLSRGAVTTCHSALCGSLDYFSWFGMFSAFRTPEEYFRETLQSEEFRDYSIHYFYMSSGNFDFALPSQLKGYDMMLDIEPRLTYGVNTCFDLFPMRYHSMGSWHLALYNFLQKIF